MSGAELSQPGQEPAAPEFFPDKPLWTPEIQRKLELVVEWVRCDLPGSHIWGLQRIGKSEFAKYLQFVVGPVFGGEAIALIWDFLGLKPKKPEDVLRRCLVDSQCKAITSRYQSVLHQRLVEVVLAKGRAARARRVILIVDELQNIPPALYDIFMSIVADLARGGLTPHLLSIGQPEMRNTIKSLHEDHALQTIGRLFPTTETYHGLSIQDVHELLQNLEGDSGEFTQSRFPGRAESGWKLTDLVTPLHQGVHKMMEEGNLTGMPLLPIGYLRPALNKLFRMMATDDQLVVDGDITHACFEFTGLPKVLGQYVEKKR